MPDQPEDRFRGTYPGGPKRRRGGEERSEPRLETVDELEERVATARGRTARGRRSRRVRMGFLVAIVVAAAAGLALGWLNERSTEDLAREREENRMRSRDVSQEVNRVLLELWKMEELERGGGPLR